MHAIWNIARREFSSYFNSPIAYIAITVFLILAGLQFFYGFLTLNSFGGEAGFFENNEASLRLFFEGIPVLFTVFLPAISMRLMSDEKRSGTLELLVTLPVRDRDIILGKYLASLMFLGVTLILTLPYTITIFWLGNPDLGPMVGGYLGLLLIGAAYLSLGLMTSTWTKNQIVAFILGALLCSSFYFVDGLIGNVWEGTRGFFEAISFKAHFSNISRGVVDTRDVFFFLSIIILPILLAGYSLESRKWKA